MLKQLLMLLVQAESLGCEIENHKYNDRLTIIVNFKGATRLVRTLNFKLQPVTFEMSEKRLCQDLTNLIKLISDANSAEEQCSEYANAISMALNNSNK